MFFPIVCVMLSCASTLLNFNLKKYCGRAVALTITFPQFFFLPICLPYALFISQPLLSDDLFTQKRSLAQWCRIMLCPNKMMDVNGMRVLRKMLDVSNFCFRKSGKFFCCKLFS